MKAAFRSNVKAVLKVLKTGKYNENFFALHKQTFHHRRKHPNLEWLANSCQNKVDEHTKRNRYVSMSEMLSWEMSDLCLLYSKWQKGRKCIFECHSVNKSVASEFYCHRCVKKLRWKYTYIQKFLWVDYMTYHFSFIVKKKFYIFL